MSEATTKITNAGKSLIVRALSEVLLLPELPKRFALFANRSPLKATAIASVLTVAVCVSGFAIYNHFHTNDGGVTITTNSNGGETITFN